GNGTEQPPVPHHTPSPPPQIETTNVPHTSLSPVQTLPQITTSIPLPSTTPTPTTITTPTRLTRSAIRIAQSKALNTRADKHESLSRGVRHGEAFITVSGLDAGQGRETIAKSSAISYDSPPRVTSFGIDEDSMQPTLIGLMAFCTNLQTKVTNMENTIKAQALEITHLKTRQEEEFHAEEVTPEKEASKLTDKDSESIGDLANVPTTSIIVSTVSATFSTASVLDSPAVPTIVTTTSPIPSSTIVTRRKGKEKMVEEESPKKSKKDLRSEQLARELAEKFELEDERRKEQIAIDKRIARIEAERELHAMIEDLDRSDEVVNKHLEEYEQHQEDLSLEEKIELIQVLLDYQQRMSHVKRFKDQQQKLTTKAARKKFYMAVESIQHFEPIDFSPKSKGVKRSREALTQEASKKLKTASQGLSKEQIELMMQIVPVEEVYPETLAVKRPILGWYVQTEGQLKRWKIVRVSEFLELYQSFEDLVKAVDREDLDTLWKMAQEL
ncbi:hypothetical protein Tco_1453187, partial [Tanacetum coccineum]